MIKQSENKAAISVAAPMRSIKAIAGAAIKAYIFLVICFAVLAVVYTYSKMPNRYLTPSINAISAMSLLMAGFEASRKAKVMGYLHGAAAGFVCSLVRILAGLMIFKSYVPTDSVGKVMLLGILISAAGGIAGVNFGKNNTKRKR